MLGAYTELEQTSKFDKPWVPSICSLLIYFYQTVIAGFAFWGAFVDGIKS